MLARVRELDGPVAFVIITLGLTLVSALVLIPGAEPTAGSATAMLRASLVYVAVIGWQPLAAYAIARRVCRDDVAFDDGVRAAGTRHALRAVALAGFVLAGSLLIDRYLHDVEVADSVELLPAVSWYGFVQLIVVFVVIVTILWLQALIEELTWRSYVLPRLMRTLGAWPGLLLHGIVWGACASPLFAVAGATGRQALAYVVTCGLIGAVLGWLRLSTRSIFASAVTNAMLTIFAGLPLVLVGGSPRFSAAFGPAGWLPCTGLVVVILARRAWRTDVAVPWVREP